MILNRDCFFYKKSDFINRLPDISEESICYIADTQQIYTRGRYFECNVTRDIVEQLIQSKGYLTPSDLPVLTGGAAPTSGEYVSGVSVGGHTVNVQKGKFSEINAGTASKLETPREIALSGDASGSIEFDGSQDVVIETTVHNSTTADRLTTPRTISLDDQATGQVSFDGSGDVTIPVTVNQLDSKNADNNDLNDLVTLNGYVGNLFYGGGGNTSENKPDGVDSFGLLTFKSAAGNYSTQILGSSNRLYTRSGADASLGAWRTIAYLTDNVASATKLQNTRTFTISDGTHSGTSSNFDGTGNVTLRLPTTINADINGDITGDITGDVVGNVTGDLYGNADTASKLENPVDISLSGDVSGSISFDGTKDVIINTTVANDSHTHLVSNLSNLHSSWDDVLVNSGVRSRELTFNGTNYPVYTAAANTSDITWYAPTGPGTIGDILQSTGDTPTWINRVTLQHELLTADAGCTRIPTNADLNDYQTPGVYYSPANADVATWSNCPTDNACSLTVLASAGVIQILREYGYSNNRKEFTRAYYNGNWTDWLQTPRISDIYTQSQADDRYVNITGDAMTGPLTMSGTSIIWDDISANWNSDFGGLRVLRSNAASANTPIQHCIGLNIDNGYKFQLASHGGGGNKLYYRGYNGNNGTWDPWVTIWHSGNGGSASGLDADLLDGQHGSWYQNNTLRFSRIKNASGSDPIDLNVDLNDGGLVRNYNSEDSWVNGPEGLTYGSAISFISDSGGSLNSQFVWDVNHDVANATKSLWFRASNNLGWDEDWHQIAFTTSNVDSASKLETARTISLSGDVTGSAIFDGSKNITINTTVKNESHTHTLANISDLQASWDAILKVAPTAQVTRWPSISEVTGKQNLTIQFNGTTQGGGAYNGTVSRTINITPSAIGAATSGHTHTTSLSSNATTNLSVTAGGTTDTIADLYATYADQLRTARTISLTGDVTGSVSFNGSKNVSITTTVANDSHSHSNYVTTNTTQDVTGLKTFARDAASILYINNTAASSTSKFSAIVFQRGGKNIGILAAGYDTNGLYRANPEFTNAYRLLDSENYTNYTYPTTISKISDLHSSWDAVLKAQKPAWLTTVSLSTISDLHSSWDALLKVAPSKYVTRWPTASEVGALTQTGADGRYVKKAGDTMSGGLRINDGNLRVGNAIFNYTTELGTSIYNANTGRYLSLNNQNALKIYQAEGSENVEVATVWHSGNDGNGSGLDADLLDGQHASKFVTIDTNQDITGTKTSIGKPWCVRMSQDTSNAVEGLIWKNTSGTDIAGLTYHNTAKRIFINANTPEVTDIWDDAAGKYSLKIGWNELTYNSYPILRSDNYDDYTVTKTGGGASGTWGINITGSAGSVDWGNVDGKPSTFTPSSHTHVTSSITSLSGYSEGSSTTTLKTSMTLNEALASLQNQIQTKQAAGNYAAANHRHYYLSGWSDTRSVVETPNSYNSKFEVVGIKKSSTYGISSGTYVQVLGFRGWIDSTGGNAHELAFADNGRIFHRDGATTSWNAWDTIAYLSDLNGYATQSWVNSQSFAKTSDIPSLDGYATQSWVSDNFQVPITLNSTAAALDITKVGDDTYQFSMNSDGLGNLITVSGSSNSTYNLRLNINGKSLTINDLYATRIGNYAVSVVDSLPTTLVANTIYFVY